MTAILIASSDVEFFLRKILQISNVNKLIVVGKLEVNLDYIDTVEIVVDKGQDPFTIADFLLNKISDSLKDLLIIFPYKETYLSYSFFILQSFTLSRAFHYLDGEFLEIPSFPIIDLTPDEHLILNTLYSEGQFSSTSNLVSAMNWPLEAKFIAKSIYLLTKLNNKGFVKTSKKGREVAVQISERGKRYFQLKKNLL